jgi:hypothetical protein
VIWTVGQPTCGLPLWAVHSTTKVLDGEELGVEHQFAMVTAAAPRLVHRTAHIRLRLTRRQTSRCYGLLRSAGDVWAWLLDSNRQRRQHGEPAISRYQALCRELAQLGTFG